MSQKRHTADAMLICVLLSLAIMAGVLVFSAFGGGSSPYSLDLRLSPVYGRKGFEGPLPDFRKEPWKQIAPAGDHSLVVVKEKFDGLPKRIFLSPKGNQPEEFSFCIPFELTYNYFENLRKDETAVLGLFIAAMGDNWEVYLNGNLIRSEMYQSEKGKIESHRAQRKIRFPFNKQLLREGDNLLVFRLAGDPNHENLGFFYGTPIYIDDYRIVERSSSEYLSAAIIGVYLFVALYHFLQYLMLKSERFNLYYALFSFMLAFYFLTRTSIVYRINPNTDIWSRIEFFTIFLIMPLLASFFESLTWRRILIPTKIYLVFCLTLSVSQLFFAPQYGEDAIILWAPTAAIAAVYIFAVNFGYAFFYRIYKEWKEKKTPGDNVSLIKKIASSMINTPLGNLAIGLMVVFATGLFDIIDSMLLNIGILTSLYGFTVFTLGTAFILVKKSGDLYNELEETNAGLEITVRERTRDLEEQTQIAVSASQAKTDFLASMSHELRTPLNAILGFAELELQSPSSEKNRARLWQIHHSGSFLLGLINDILDISKIENGKVELHSGEYDPASFLNDTISLNTVRIGSKPIAFHADIDPNIPARLYGDELRIRQILNNLLSNAFKYTNEGEVRLGIKAEKNIGGFITLYFTVSDTGIGITKEDQEKLFDQYSRVGSERIRSIEGTGLGLSITRRLVKMMDGDISVESEYGKGSVFTVWIMQKIIDASPIGEALTRTLKNMTYRNLKLNGASFERIRLPGVSVLVTDDVESNLNVAKGLLSLFGLTVDCARSGEEAIRLCGKKRYDMIFMDQMMAGMDGIEAAKIIRENEKPEDNQFTPIIALTANALIGSEKLFLENGFDGFLAKPLNAEELDKVLRRHFTDKTSLSDGNIETTTAEKTKENNFIIEGINPVRGLANCDGDEESYRYILNSFCDDAPNKLDVLKHMIYRLTKNSEAPGEQTLEIIKTILRTLKNATRSIGAEDLAAYSVKLEETAGTNGADGLVEDLARFQSMLAETVERIKRALF